jgi:hypothetical protein
MAKKKKNGNHVVSNIGSQAEDGKALKRRKTINTHTGMTSVTESPTAGRFGKRIVRSVSNPYKPIGLRPEFGGGKDLKSTAQPKMPKGVATTKKAAREKGKAEKKYARTTVKSARKATTATKKAASKKAKTAKKVSSIQNRTAKKVNRINRRK